MIMKTNCRIEYSQDYLQSRDMTLVFEEMFVTTQSVNGEPEENCVRERICGFYHGEPDEDLMKQYMFNGCEAVMADEIFESMEKDTMTEWLKNNGITDSDKKKCEARKLDKYKVIIYSGFDEKPLIRYYREYTTLEEAHEEHKCLYEQLNNGCGIQDNATDEYYKYEDCCMLVMFRNNVAISLDYYINKNNVNVASAITNYLNENNQIDWKSIDED